jgi:hypothetical protein
MLRELEILWKTLAEALKALGKALESIGERMEELSETERKEKVPAEPVEPVEKKIAIKAEEKAAAEPAEAEIVIEAEEKEAPVKEKRVTAAQAVLDVIKASRKGVDTAMLKEKTGFNEKKIRNAVYKLKKRGKIKSERKGIYVKV